MMRCPVLLLASLALVLSAPEGHAQTEVAGDTVCVNASRALSVSTLTSDVSNALAALITCPESGPRAIAKFWSTGPHDRDIMASLAEVTGRLRDRRLHMVGASIRRKTVEVQGQDAEEVRARLLPV